MQHTRVAGIVSLCVLAFSPWTVAGTLKLDRVMMSTGGVAYTEFKAEVEGAETLRLPVRLDQVDDVLKSLVVFDPAGGIGGISLPGRAPLAQIFRDLPFDQSALTSPTALLNALQGAEVAIAGTRAVTGRLLQVVAVPVLGERGQKVEIRHRVSLITETGLDEVELESAESIRFRDPALRQAVAEALDALLAHKAQDSRTLEIALEGEGPRTVRVGFVAAAPLWKTTYRVVLPRQGEAALLQGWAVLENMTGHGWDEVQVTLLSGNPVTFRQSLYESYYVDRPEIPVEIFGRVLPRKDTGALPPSPARMEREMAKAELDQAAGGRAYAEAGPPGGLSLRASTAPMRPSGGAAAVESDVATAQVIYPFPKPISLADGESAMLPLINRDMPIARIALYQPETHARHPLAAVRMHNDGAAPLPPGIVTLFEQPGTTGANRFLGDAELPYLPSGAERLVTFALDQDITVDRETAGTRDLVKASIARGQLRIVHQQRQTTLYRIANASDLARTVVLEHPRDAGWTIDTRPDAPEASLTESHHRIPVAVAANGSAVQAVIATRPVSETRRLANLNPGQIGLYLSGQDLPKAIRDALAEIGERKAAIDALQGDLSRLEAEHRDIAADQDRLRRNLGSVPQGSDLARRYLAALEAQEDRLAEIRQARERLDGKIAAAERDLAAFIDGLTL